MRRERDGRRFGPAPGGVTGAAYGDGIVYAAADRLWIRRFDQADPREVPRSLFAERPFWSPDGSELAFVARGQLWKLGVDAGGPVPLCDLPGTGRIVAAAWRPDGAIVFSSRFGPLYRVSAGGGDPVVFHEDPAVIDFHEISLGIGRHADPTPRRPPPPVPSGGRRVGRRYLTSPAPHRSGGPPAALALGERSCYTHGVTFRPEGGPGVLRR